MSIITRPLPAVKAAPTRRPFGAGILATCPHFTVTDRTVSDEAWLVADNAARKLARENARLEQLAGAALATDRMANGVCF
jgi:hypothetical protein